MRNTRKLGMVGRDVMERIVNAYASACVCATWEGGYERLK